jgi:primosomal protein N' (replication factor Y)
VYYYELALLSSPLSPLTYQSDGELQNGQIVTVPLQRRTLRGVVLSRLDEPEYKTLPVKELSEECYSPGQIAVARFIAEYYFSSLGEALALFVPFREEEHEESEATDSEIPSTSIILSERQQQALAFLHKHPVSLLFGDTGAGKTEIYMKYFEEVIASKKRCIFLMPEISLTPQMQVRLERHFGDAVVMWHSKLTRPQKEKILNRLHEGSVRIVAGPRSALFLPVRDPGLIVVDEEHDESYKSASRPRYHARDMAIYIGKMLGIPVVLGSATPSLTSYAKYPHARLKGGHYGTERRFVFEESREAITPLVEEAIVQTVKNGEQAMLFIPTRANFKYLICEACGYTYSCPYCSVGMSLHRNARAIKCHYCNYTEPIPQSCPKCRHTMLTSTRLGTAEAVEQFREQHPEFVTGQFDRDVITTQKKLKTLLKQFNDKEIDLLVGTQMLSKGHDYHDVTLAVVLGLDNILNLSDYRAREKALSLLIQIAGRSGRKKAATVLVQSFNQEFFEPYVGRYEAFLDEEKLFREGMYPPYKKLARVLFAHKNGLKAQEAMTQMVMCLQQIDAIQIVGYGPSPIEKIANKYRFQILLRSDKSTDLIRAIKACKNDLAEVDMDPIEFA